MATAICSPSFAPRRPPPSAPKEPHMLASAAGELATALNMFGTTPKADLMLAKVCSTVPVASLGTIRVILLMFLLFMPGGVKPPVRRWQSANRPLVASSDAHHLPGATLPGRLRSPEATLNTLSTHKSGAWRLALTLRPAVTPSNEALAMPLMSATGMFTATVSPVNVVGYSGLSMSSGTLGQVGGTLGVVPSGISWTLRPP